jgi:DNA-binding SARP family transcriptional activator/TolB-like protein
MIELKTFGGLRLASASGAAIEIARRRLVLLAIVAVAGERGVSRDRLVSLLWPDSSSESGRHSLEQLLSTLRKQFGDAIFVGVDPVRTNSSDISCDVTAFEAALQRGDLANAVALYQGPFLDGFHLNDARDFEDWAERERGRLVTRYAAALERLAAQAGQQGDHAAALGWWQALVLVDPVGTKNTLGLMRALAASGDRAGAIRHARVHEALLREQLELPPDPAVTALVQELHEVTEHARGRDVSPAKSAGSAPAPATTAPVIPEPEPHAENRVVRQAAVSRRRRGVLMAVGLVLATGAAVVLMTRQPRPEPTTTGPPSITVVPFEVRGDEVIQLLARGLEEGLTRGLGKLGLRVVSHESAAVLARRGMASTAVGDSLGVRYVLTGLVRQDGNRVRVNATLTHVRDASVVWTSVPYEHALRPEQLWAIEDDIVHALERELAIALSQGASRTLVSRPASTIEAYRQYLQGRRARDRQTLEGVEEAVRFFQQAIASDSVYALAYVGLADAYTAIGIGNIGDFRAGEFFPRAREAALHALVLDSSLAEAHAAIGFIRLLYDLDWQAAERDLSRAIELNPSYVTAHAYMASLLELTGDFAGAVQAARTAVAHDPLSLYANVELGRGFFFARELDSAAVHFWQALQLDSTQMRARLHLAQVYQQQGRHDEAIREFERVTRTARRSSRPLSLLANALATAGRRPEALRLLDSLRARAARGYVPAFDFAIAHVGMGNVDDAFQWLDRSFADHSLRPYLMDPTFDAIRSDPRYAALLRRLRLPRVQIAR